MEASISIIRIIFALAVIAVCILRLKLRRASAVAALVPAIFMFHTIVYAVLALSKVMTPLAMMYWDYIIAIHSVSTWLMLEVYKYLRDRKEAIMYGD